jgi:hypothetical protein
MKSVVAFGLLVFSLSSFADCPNLFSGKFEVKNIESSNSWVSFPSEDRPNVILTDGDRIVLTQSGCNSVDIKIIEKGPQSRVSQNGVLPLVATTAPDYTYNTPEKVEWTKDKVKFSRSVGVWPFFRKYTVTMKRHADGTIEAVDHTTGCALLPSPIPETWTQIVHLVPIR